VSRNQPPGEWNEDVLYNPDFVLLNHLGAAAFDRQRGLLYVLEPLADEDRSIVHVWRVEGGDV
jgi:hypothetical protein